VLYFALLNRVKNSYGSADLDLYPLHKSVLSGDKFIDNFWSNPGRRGMLIKLFLTYSIMYDYTGAQ